MVVQAPNREGNEVDATDGCESYPGQLSDPEEETQLGKSISRRHVDAI
jgi:hypothetical protein